jgi:hypothetical protein
MLAAGRFRVLGVRVLRARCPEGEGAGVGRSPPPKNASIVYCLPVFLPLVDGPVVYADLMIASPLPSGVRRPSLRRAGKECGAVFGVDIEASGRRALSH